MTHPAPAPETDRLLSGYSGRLLGVVWGCALVSHLGWLVLPALLPQIIADLGITATRAGIALSLLLVFSAAVRYPGGRLADQLSRKTVLAASLASWLVGYAVLAIATSFPVFLLGVAFVGIGLGAFIPAAFAQLSDVFHRKQGQAFGVTEAGLQLGGVLAGGLAIVALALGSWRAAFLPLIAGVLVLLILLHRWSAERYALRWVEHDFRTATLRVLQSPRVRLLLVLTALFAFVYQGAISFLPTFLETERGLTPAGARIAFAGMFLAGAIAAPFSGGLGDRIGVHHAMAAMLVTGLAGLTITITSPAQAGVYLGAFVLGVGLIGFWPVTISSLMLLLPDEHKAGDFGIFGMGYMIVGSLGPTAIGATGDHLSFTTAYLGLTVVFLFCLVIVGWLYHH